MAHGVQSNASEGWAEEPVRVCFESSAEQKQVPAQFLTSTDSSLKQSMI